MTHRTPYTFSPKKIFLLISVVCFSVLLSGCLGSSSSTQNIGFASFTIDIPDTFAKVPAGLVENKQILNKVIASFSIENEDGFDSNFIVTTSPLATDINYEQFWTVNTNKLKEYVQGFQLGDKDIVSFTCEEKEVDGILITFTVKDSFYKNTDTYYLSQYQFVKDDIGYIISHASANKDDQKLLKKRIKTLSCGA